MALSGRDRCYQYHERLQGLIGLCQPQARVILVGPSTPLSPIMYDYGIDVLSGTIVTDPQAVMTGIGQGICFHQLRQKKAGDTAKGNVAVKNDVEFFKGYRAFVSFSRECDGKSTFFENEHILVGLNCLEIGQEMEKHAQSGTVPLLCCVGGKGERYGW